MTTYNHARYDIVSFYDLEPSQQSVYDYAGSEESSYCININDSSDVHDLGNFMHTSGNRYHGIASCSNTSAYGIVISACGEQAVIALLG